MPSRDDRLLILLTSEFPFGNSETFLESEVKFHQNDSYETIICPIEKSNDEKRPLPKKIQVSTSLILERTILEIIKGLLQGLFSSAFWKEIFANFFILMNWKCFKSFVGTTYSSFILSQKLCSLVSKNQNKGLIVYSYWYDIAFYAAVLAKKKYPKINIITRAHGFDINPNIREKDYFPFKKQLSKKYFYYFPISQLAKKRIFSFTHSSNIFVSHLGTERPQKKTSKKLAPLSFVSCSACKDIKRINLIIHSIRHYASKNFGKKISWLHLGGGPLLEELKAAAQEAFSSLKNMTFSFAGQVTNKEIFEIYGSNHFDMFINLSSTEGIPVSIMEAISFNIPVIATDVGGTSEIVSNAIGGTGILLEENFTWEDFNKAVNDIVQLDLRPYPFWQKHFNADINYRAFSAHITQIFNNSCDRHL